MGIGDSNEMGQNQRRPGFLRWGEGARDATADTGADVAAPATTDEAEPGTPAAAPDAPTPGGAAGAEASPAADPPAGAGAAGEAPTEGAPAPTAAGSTETPFLRDLVGAMRGVAESSRETTVAEFRQRVEQRVEELKAAAAERADDLRRRSELDLGGIGDWERSELERVRAEAEQRRKTRRELLEKELSEHQAASDRDLDALRGRLADYERAMDDFFAGLDGVEDPAAFVAAAKRMPAPPDLGASGAPPAPNQAATPAAPPSGNGTPADTGEERLAERLAQLDERLGAATAPTQRAGETTPEAPAEAPAEPAPASSAAAAGTATAASATATAPATTAAPAAPPSPPAVAANETSTAIVVKGLGSFGAITSFKQALERVEGIRGVTLSLGPTGDFVYRASHPAEFDLGGAIRSIEGPNAAIEEVDGQLRVTIERPR
jgi:hypothetical protein